MSANGNKNTLEIVVAGLIQEAHELLSKTINDTKAADDWSKQHRVTWTDRHRLHVLLEAAEETMKNLPRNVVVAPWFLAEFRTTLDVVRRWQKHPLWKEIEPSLKSPNDFTHTILTLHVAEHLERGGHAVDIVPTGDNASPDLMIHAIGGTQDLTHIECYQPGALCGKPSDISAEEAESIVKRSMKKAKRQLGSRNPGILAICGYNQSHSNLELLRQTIESRLQKTFRHNLCGIWLITLGVLLNLDKDKLSFTSTINANFIPNPSYFGRVDIDAKVPEGHPQLIKGRLIDINTDNIGAGDINLVTSLAIASNNSSMPVKKVRSRITRTKKLNIIEEPKQLSRAVVHGSGNKVPPLFKGEGNIDYLCGHCEFLLAKRVWDVSISNIVVQCPSCHRHNDFPDLPNSDYDKIQLTKGNYNFTDAVILRRGMYIGGE